LLELTNRELNSCRVIGQVIRNQRQTTYGQKFIQYICYKIKEDHVYKSYFFRMLNVIAKDSPNI